MAKIKRFEPEEILGGFWSNILPIIKITQSVEKVFK
jgi:hypothetical protein